MSSGEERLPDWERLLAAERHLQAIVPGAVLVEGLRARFDQVLEDLEAVAGWRTERLQRPVLILGQLDGILTGIRQLRRTRPLDTEQVAGLRVPTLAEMARIKAWLLATRHALRDYLDTVVLLERLGEKHIAEAFRSFDELYRQEGGASPLAEVVERLSAAEPKDRAEVDLAHYRGIRSPWDEWRYLRARGRYWAERLARVALEQPS